MAGMYDDMPGLVNFDLPYSPPSADPFIPPPVNATYDQPYNNNTTGGGQTPYSYPGPDPYSTFPSTAFPGHTGRSPYSQPCYDDQWPYQNGGQPTMPTYAPPQSAFDGPVPMHRRTHSHPGTPAGYGPPEPQTNTPWPAWEPSSQALVSRKPTMHGSISHPSDYSPASTLSTSISAKRLNPTLFTSGEPPRDWRRDFKFRSGLSALFHIKRSPSKVVSDFVDSSKCALHMHLRYDNNHPPLAYDLRKYPSTVSFRGVDRIITPWDMQQYACEPPAVVMRVYSSRLPWYIDIGASNPMGVTLGDVFTELYTALNTPVQKADYYNDELDDSDRLKLKRAWEDRCVEMSEKMKGVKKVDYLREKVIFEGLVRGKDGMWQLKTRKE